ncbi:OmpA family protein [Hymenobacter arizonensis]|uniref:Outer membrane protein OmpA n=1 Tax=Hymenobacter arizonensis TaxID=1227077 RepID=A0A1I5TS45_HYMAR|nr:OmpA family protein [Hymenobacter arizonensis]SFP85808.1 Outer membrane protein OmpA [Hymenobacter arizonensis]
MKNDVVETVKACFTSNVIAQLSIQVDETEPNVRKATNKSVPLVLKGLLNRLDRGFAPEVLFELGQAAHAADVLKQLATAHNTVWSESGTNLLPDLLGDSYRANVSQIAVGTSIRPSASGALLQAVATAVLGVLGKTAAENEFGPTELAGWLREQSSTVGSALLKDAIESALVSPPGARQVPEVEPERAVVRQPIAGVPALQAAAPWAPQAAEPAPADSSSFRWQWGALILLAVCLGYIFGTGQASKKLSDEAFIQDETTATGGSQRLAGLTPGSRTGSGSTGPVGPDADASRSAAPSTASREASPAPVMQAGRYDKASDRYIYDTGQPITLTLPNGTRQQVGSNSTENRLYTFLSSSEEVDSVNRTKGWINFDRVNFEAGKAVLTPESAEQLGNMAVILNSFPNSMVKIGGYTDSTGDAELNYRLSDERAHTAMLALAKRGVNPIRLQAKGYGPRYFVMPNNTPVNRSLNRRVSIRVVKK